MENSERGLEPLVEANAASVFPRKRLSAASGNRIKPKMNVPSFYMYFSELGEMDVPFLEASFSGCGLQSVIKLLNGAVLRAATHLNPTLCLELVYGQFPDVRCISGTHGDIFGANGKGEHEIVADLICETQIECAVDVRTVVDDEKLTIVILAEGHIEKRESDRCPVPMKKILGRLVFNSNGTKAGLPSSKRRELHIC